MVSDTTTVEEAAVLSAARRFRREANAAEAGVLQTAVEWARLHEVTDLDEAATWLVGPRGQDTGIPLAGPGAPLVSEFAVAEFATALGLPAGSGRNLMAHALELAHRLPKLWARVQDGSLAPWRARRVAEETLHLSAEAVAWVDGQVGPFAHRTGPAQTQRLVAQAIARFMPETAAEQRERAGEQRYFTIEHHQVSFAGTSRVHGELDLADALDLDDALTRGAAQLATLGNDQSLDVRRSLAAGILARGQHALDFGSTTGHDPATTGPTAPTAREVVLYVHLSADAVRAGDPDAAAWVENAGGHLLTTAQIEQWCGRPDTGRITVKPVIDLNVPLATDGYRVPDRIAESVRLRDRECVFPWCHRPARRCDLDHVVPWDPDGPPGQTSTDNLACLCRLHHRMKTHGGWSYTMLDPAIAPGVFLWRGPHGHQWLRDRTGTTDVTPPTALGPVDPPERRTS